ncbi:protein with a C-terminal OMP (outer membrane protein) domain containing protein [Bradyrhizobium sp. NAS80.1]|uniref:autotransporter outer membrane beta-barrel domain-containing protein n=1 Tax=Bradyrhizobium sp. NAS80.1 TaxID=1680159 RepID=UPI000966E72F|nr:autotransporter domain-containing protein [Bradyrhizobium sp. NAS80.1]OKO79873.1 protein with a C-terminal OMP (outer membrane protein) domain containing protein [Bradyrhizobium sp. NAS80.1]
MRGEGPRRRQDRLRRYSAASLVSASALFVGFSLWTAPANALCAPDPASSGQTVTCSGTDVDGFQAGAGVDSLNVNVLSTATVNDNGTVSIGVNDSNTVTNSGRLSAGSGLTGIGVGNFNTVTNNGIITVLDNGLGIQAIDHNVITNAGTITSGDGGAAISVGDNNTVTNSGGLSVGASGTGIFSGQTNTITNAATGTITGGNGSTGIFVFAGGTVTNAGAITVGDSPGFSGGILAINAGNTVTNTATGTISVGQNAAGIFMQGAFETASNFGAITAGDFGVGIAVIGDDAKVTNGGTITAGDSGSAGISVQGDRATISQSGTINVGLGGAGIAYGGSSGTITNSGRITGADFAGGMVVFGDSNIVTNNGTITVGAAGIGMDVTAFTATNQVVNTGTITVGANGVGISVSGGASVFNSGTINAATGFAAIEFCSCGPNTLTLGPGSVINGFVLGAGADTFQLGGTGKGTFDLSLIGSGLQYDGFTTFNKVDNSTWTVTGTGNQDWNVLGGTLMLAGTINGTVTVAAGGTFGGVGTVGTTTVNGGTLAPGNPTGTLTVSGDLSFTSASSYMVQVTGASSGLTVITGTATLGGATVVVVPNGSVAKHYTILNAATLPDTFNPVVSGLSPNLKASLSYDPNNVFLDLALSYGSGLNVNQQNVANALTNVFNSTGSLPVVLANLSPAGLTQASGEPATGSQQTTFDAMNLFLGLLTDVFGSGRSGTPGATPFADDANAYAATGRGARDKAARDAFASIYRKAPAATFEQRWDVWAAGYGGSQTTDGNAALGSNNTSSSVYGTAVGLDYRFSPSTIAGFALAGGGTGFSVNGLGWGRSDLFQAGAFVRHTAGPAYITAALAYGWQDVTTNRIVTAAGVDQLRAQFNANAFSGRVEGGYRHATQWIGLTPYAALQATKFSLPNYSEFAVVGSNAFALNYAAKDVTSTRTELGLRADRSFAAAGGLMTLRGRVAWAHDYNPDRTVGAVFQTLPGAAFVVNGAALARDSALTTASVQMNWMNGWSASATFEGEFSNVTRSYAGKGVVRYAW